MTKDEIAALEQQIGKLTVHLKHKRAPKTIVRAAVDAKLALEWCKTRHD